MINPAVIYFASVEPFLTKSREIVDEIAFSKVSTLDVTKRVQRVINTNDIGRFKSSWSIKLKLGFSKPFPAPTEPANPRIRIVKKQPNPAKIEALCKLLVFSAEKDLCQYPCEKISAAVTATITAKADLKLKNSNVSIPPVLDKDTNSLNEF